jgi:hypothetical protein
MHKIAMALIGAFLVFPLADAWAQSAPLALTPQEEQSIIAAVKNELVDPDSAVFKDVVIYRQNGVPIACGLVNSKNRMGGYSGFTPFTANPVNALVYQERYSEAMWDDFWRNFCRNVP